MDVYDQIEVNTGRWEMMSLFELTRELAIMTIALCDAKQAFSNLGGASGTYEHLEETEAQHNTLQRIHARRQLAQMDGFAFMRPADLQRESPAGPAAFREETVRPLAVERVS